VPLVGKYIGIVISSTLCQHWRMSRTMNCRASKFVCLHGGSFEMKGKNVDKNNVDVDIGVQLWRPIHSRILHSKYRPREPNLSCTGPGMVEIYTLFSPTFCS
jgi:hypothetical protein